MEVREKKRERKARLRKDKGFINFRRCEVALKNRFKKKNLSKY